MANTISNSYEMTFYNIQPICYSIELMKLINYLTIKKDLPKFYLGKEDPLWLKNFKNLGNTYQSIISLNVNISNINELKQDLNNKNFFVNKTTCLDEYINYNQTEVVLLYNYLTHCFILCYKIPLLIKENKISKLTEVDDENNRHNNLYSTIRKLMVRENNDSIISNWAKTVEDKTLNIVYDILSYIFKTKKIDKNSIYIQTNTGNITNIITNNNKIKENIINNLLSLNHIAERLDYNNNPIHLKDGTVYSFNGRFHTIILQKPTDKNRFIPIQFHMQYLWMYTTKMYELMDYVNRELTENNSVRLLKDLNIVINNIILKIQYLSLFHNNFKRAIESDYINIYLKIEKYWNLDDNLNGTAEYINNFKDYLSRNYLSHTEKANSRQNRILYLISMLQLISLIGVWSSYISLVDKNDFDGQFLLRIFGNKENLIRFNIYLPLFFLLIIAVLLGIGFFQKRRQ
ncbi:MAG: hypothetical protein ACOCV1_02810 [Bacillota bacterium]